jgi:hypothetical protein
MRYRNFCVGSWIVSWRGWCWKKVTPFLSKEDHDVYAPTFTCLGERSHLASRIVGLDTHILDIIQVLEYESLNEVKDITGIH